MTPSIKIALFRVKQTVLKCKLIVHIHMASLKPRTPQQIYVISPYKATNEL